MIPLMDFETYSEAGFDIDPNTGKVRGVGSQGKGGLPVVGTPVYAEHPSTEVLCLYYDLKDGRGRRGWFPGTPSPADLLGHIAAGGLIEAWNVTFEFWIWNMICVRRYGWPVLTMEQCRCAMAKSRRHSLPGALGNAAKVLGTAQKDKNGGRLIQKLSRPHTPTKNRPAIRWTPATAWDDFLSLYNYCDGDVVAEDEASARIPDLTPDEFAVWQLDQKINARGVRVDVEALDAMLDILGQAERKYTLELAQISGGAVGSVSEVAKFGDWLASVGLPVDNLQKDTVSARLKKWQAALRGDEIPADAHPVDRMVRDELLGNPNLKAATRALEIRDILGAANVKKLRTLKLQVSSDGRLRDQYTYCGADRTGRFSAGGVQLQNITSKGPKSCKCEACGAYFGATPERLAAETCPFCGSFMFHTCNDWTVDAVMSAIQCILSRDLNTVENVWGDPVAVLCGCLRGLFIASRGYDFVCCDFSAIEAVAAACLARCHWRIEVFSGHGKIYEESASRATGIPFDEILDYKKQNGMHHPARKTIGKVRELAGGYGGWINAWKNFGADEFMDDDEIKADVLKWRDESPEIVDMWGGQFRWCGPGKWDYRPELFGLEGAAISAIMYPGQYFAHIDITYTVQNDILYCRLPSGRFLHYHRPRLANVQDKLNRGPSYEITFEGYNSNSQKGPIGWHRMETYGGRLFENCIAENTPVLTLRGWVPIQYVLACDFVHDGVEWVAHSGLLFKNKQTCVTVDGVLMTPDHEVLTDDGWKTASQNPRPYRPDFRHVNSGTSGRQRREETPMGVCVRVWRNVRESIYGRQKRHQKRPHAELWLRNETLSNFERFDSRHEPPSGVCGLPLYAGPLRPADPSGVGELRRPGHYGLRSLATRLHGILGGYGGRVPAGRTARPKEQCRGVLGRELPVGACKDQRKQQTDKRADIHAARAYDYLASVGRVWRKGYDFMLSTGAQLAGCRPVPKAEFRPPQKVYDIVNAGPRRRFVVLGDNGPFIVHNCVQAVALDIQAEALLRLEARGYPVVMHTHDEAVAEVPEGVGSVDDMASIMSERPAWASWWPLRAAGWRHKRYQKD